MQAGKSKEGDIIGWIDKRIGWMGAVGEGGEVIDMDR